MHVKAIVFFVPAKRRLADGLSAAEFVRI